MSCFSASIFTERFSFRRLTVQLMSLLILMAPVISSATAYTSAKGQGAQMTATEDCHGSQLLNALHQSLELAGGLSEPLMQEVAETAAGAEGHVCCDTACQCLQGSCQSPSAVLQTRTALISPSNPAFYTDIAHYANPFLSSFNPPPIS